MLQITPSFGKKYFFFPNGLNYLMMNSNAVEKKKKKLAGQLPTWLQPKGKLWVPPPRWSLCPGTLFCLVWILLRREFGWRWRLDKMNPGWFLALRFFAFTHLPSVSLQGGLCVDSRDRINVHTIEVEEQKPEESRGFAQS